MTKEERYIAVVQAIVSIAESVAAIKDEVLAMRSSETRWPTRSP